MDKWQRAAGRLFRAELEARLARSLAEDAPGATCPTWIRHYRHECPGQRGLSWTVLLGERYVTSPEYWVCYCSSVGTHDRVPHEDCDGGRVAAERGLFAYHWKEGRCAHCGFTVRSGDGGKLVLAASRPPLRGAVVEEM